MCKLALTNKGRRLLSAADEARQVKHLENLDAFECASIGSELEFMCEYDEEFSCGSPFCFYSGNEFAAWRLKETKDVIYRTRATKVRVWTIVSQTIPLGTLKDLDLNLAKRQLTKWLSRSEESPIICIGGLEIALRVQEGCWSIHFHLVTIGADKTTEKAVREHVVRIAGKRTFHAVDLKDPEEQIPYTLKFAFYHRPGTQTGPTRPRAVPLPEPAYKELAQFYSGRRIQDFLFLKGVRKIRGALIPVGKAEILLAKKSKTIRLIRPIRPSFD